MGLLPRIESVPDFCSESDIDSFRRFRCAGLAAELRPQESLPEMCEGLIKSMSAWVNNGAVGDYHTHLSHCHTHPAHLHGDRVSLSLQVQRCRLARTQLQQTGRSLRLQTQRDWSLLRRLRAHDVRFWT